MSEQRAFPCCDCRKKFYMVTMSSAEAQSYDDEVDLERYDDHLGCWVPEVSSFEAWLRDHEELDGDYRACSDCGSDS